MNIIFHYTCNKMNIDIIHVIHEYYIELCYFTMVCYAMNERSIISIYGSRG